MPTPHASGFPEDEIRRLLADKPGVEREFVLRLCLDLNKTAMPAAAAGETTCKFGLLVSGLCALLGHYFTHQDDPMLAAARFLQKQAKQELRNQQAPNN